MKKRETGQLARGLVRKGLTGVSLCLALTVWTGSAGGASGPITTFAGYQRAGAFGDGGPATRAGLSRHEGIVVDSGGNLYIADTENHRVRRVGVSGTIRTIAGTGVAGSSGDGGAATDATLDGPTDVVVDGAGNVFIADTGNHRIRMINPTGQIRTFAGTGSQGSSGLGGLAAEADLNAPAGLLLDDLGNLLIADTYNHRIVQVGSDGVLTKIAGVGFPGFADGQASAARFNRPTGLSFDAIGALLVADRMNHRIRKVETGNVTTVAGNGTAGFFFNGVGPATSATLNEPTGVVVDGLGNLLIADRLNHRIRIVGSDGTISTFAGTGLLPFAGDGGPATEATLNQPADICIDPSGRVLIAEWFNLQVRRVDASGLLTTVAGSLGDGGPITHARLRLPRNTVVDDAGNTYISDSGNARVRMVEPEANVVVTIAGNGIRGFSGDGGPATEASLSRFQGIALDSDGNLYIADTNNNRVRKVDGDTGIISTVVGSGETGALAGAFFGDGGPATFASFAQITTVQVDGRGDLYVCDRFNHRIRKVDAATKIVTTVAGSGVGGRESGGFSGDGGSATLAQLNSPRGLFLDRWGNIFISDTANWRIRRVDAATGVVTTVAGNGLEGFSGDGGPATSARLGVFKDIFVDGAGHLFIGSEDNNRVRRVDAETGVITTVAGKGSRDYSGDGGPATLASLNDPKSVFIDRLGSLYIADEDNNVIRKVNGVGVPTHLRIGTFRGPTQPDLGISDGIGMDVALASDFDGSGRVDFVDFLELVEHFGLANGSEGFDARFDLNGDDVVGFSDFILFARAFSES